PASTGVVEIESADDFILADQTVIDHATVTGLIPAGAPLSAITDVRIEIYRVFPKDSDTGRTPNGPTRHNSPSDIAFDDRDSAASELSFSALVNNTNFTASNSVLNGINKSPGQTTGGDGAVSGQEVTLTITFSKPFELPADHYFFVPQVQLASGNFF